MSLLTGTKIHRYDWKMMPMTQDVLQRVEELSKNQAPVDLMFDDDGEIEQSEQGQVQVVDDEAEGTEEIVDNKTEAEVEIPVQDEEVMLPNTKDFNMEEQNVANNELVPIEAEDQGAADNDDETAQNLPE